MSDLVERLRKPYFDYICHPDPWAENDRLDKDRREAADLILKLQAELERERNEASYWKDAADLITYTDCIAYNFKPEYPTQIQIFFAWLGTLFTDA